MPHNVSLASWHSVSIWCLVLDVQIRLITRCSTFSSTLSLDNHSNFLPIRRQGPKKIRFRENSLESIEKVIVDVSRRFVLLKMTSEASQCRVGILAISVKEAFLATKLEYALHVSRSKQFISKTPTARVEQVV